MKYKEKFEKEKSCLYDFLKSKDNQKEYRACLKLEVIYLLNLLGTNSFSREEIERFILKNETSGSRNFYDYLLVYNAINTYDYIFDNYKKEKIDSFFIQKLHRMLYDKIDTNAGFYRKIKVKSPLKLKFVDVGNISVQVKDFENYISKSDEDVIRKIFDINYLFLCLSPFKEGNFLISILLMLALLLKEGYPPILLRSIDKKRYFEVIENYQLKSKKEEYYHFMSMMLMRSFKMVLENRQKNVNKKDLLTISKFASVCEIPVSTVRYWMKEGKIKPAYISPTGYALFSKDQRFDLQETKLNQMIVKCMNTLKKGIEKSINE